MTTQTLSGNSSRPQTAYFCIFIKGFLCDFRETRLTPQTVGREFDLLKSFSGYEDTCCLESIEWVLGKD